MYVTCAETSFLMRCWDFVVSGSWFDIYHLCSSFPSYDFIGAKLAIGIQ